MGRPSVDGPDLEPQTAKSPWQRILCGLPSVREPIEPAVQVTDVERCGRSPTRCATACSACSAWTAPPPRRCSASGSGESSGSTSYHLRQLAAYGFVEELPDHGTGRERWWQARHRMTSWQAEQVVGQEGGSEVQDEMTRLQVTGHGRVLDAWLQQRAALGPAWTTAASINDYALRLTPEQARTLADELLAVLDRWSTQHPAAEPADGSELVSVLLDVVPLQEWPT
jgi:hypothetical protein